MRTIDDQVILVTGATDQAYDQNARRLLWPLSEELTGLRTPPAHGTQV